MRRLSESTGVVLRASVIAAGVVGLGIWMHNRVDAIEKRNAGKDVEISGMQKADAELKADVGAIRTDVGDIKGDVREIRAILEHRTAGGSQHRSDP